MLWEILIGLGVALAITWLGLVVLLVVARPPGGAVREGLRILPDTLRLLHRLAADRATPRGIKLRLALLFVYLAMPIDIIPDFVPGLGYADDVGLVGVVLRSVVRRAGPDAVRAHWPGTPEGLTALWRLARLERVGARSEDQADRPGN